MYKEMARVWACLVLFMLVFAGVIPFLKKGVTMGIMGVIVIFCILSALYTY